MIETPDNAIVPPVGSELDIQGFRYRIHKVTQKDIVLRPVGFAEPARMVKMTFWQRLRFLVHS